MTWCCTRLEDVQMEGEEAHVHPTYEEHVIDRGCWCGPKRIEGIDVFPIYLHRDLLEQAGPSVGACEVCGSTDTYGRPGNAGCNACHAHDQDET